MNKQELIAALENGRREFLKTIEGLPEENMIEPGVVGDWSVKDILAHLSRWEAELVTLLFQAQQGNRPTTVQLSDASTDELNAKWYAQTRERPLDRVMADFEGVRDQTIRRVQALADRDLDDPKRFDWLDGHPLVEWITSDSTKHEAEHGAQIRAWRDRLGL